MGDRMESLAESQRTEKWFCKSTQSVIPGQQQNGLTAMGLMCKFQLITAPIPDGMSTWQTSEFRRTKKEHKQGVAI